jgi:two-component system C4-dicarboxylate transport response regulator DctD
MRHRDDLFAIGGDGALAAQSAVPLLITAATDDQVACIARRVHTARYGDRAPLAIRHASSFVASVERFAVEWEELSREAIFGSILVLGVEAMPAPLQSCLADRLAARTRDGSGSHARVMAGTTVPLFERVESGTFSAALFYRLNFIHLVVSGAAEEVA